MKLIDDKKFLEPLANLEHERWSHWQKYLHSQCIRNDDGSLTIPKELVERWERQINTNYSELSSKEKNSDRNEARKTINLINKISSKNIVKESLC